MHMVRNAMDHGIEVPADRVGLRQKPVGRLLLKAQHLSGQVVIEISDDGRGLDASKIKAKAVPKRVDCGGKGAFRKRDLQPDFLARFHHRGPGNQRFRARRGHGRGSAAHREAARENRNPVERGAWLRFSPSSCR